MLKIGLIIIAIILFIGIMGDSEKFNKRTYCYGFIACVIALLVLNVLEAVL